MKIFEEKSVKILLEYNNIFFEKKLSAFGYPINKMQHINRTHIDWDIMKGYSFMYDYNGNYDMSLRLKNSKLCKPEHRIILELSPNNPIIELPSVLFAENWEDILNENSYGISGLSTDGKLVFEFTDDSDYLLHSNFLI